MRDLHTLELPKRSVKGLGLVVLIHALILWGLASGLATHIVKKITPPAVFIDKPDKPKPIEHPMTEAPEVVFKDVVTPVVPLPDIRIDQPPSPITVETVADPQRREPGVGPGGTPGPDAGLTQTPVRPAGPLQAEAVCHVMATPEVPAVNWNGKAVFRIQARLQAGRVAEVQFLSMAGGMDARTRRALQQAVQTALGAYQCQGSQAFEQEFVFSIQ